MSYSIFYNKQFIKVGDNLYLPIIEAGCNNVYEASGNGRKRSRDWSNNRWITGGKTICTREEIESSIEQIRNDAIANCSDYVKRFDESWAYDEKRFGYHTGLSIYGKRTSTTTFGNFKGFFMRGCDEALTIEELLQKSVNVRIRLPYWFNDKELTEKGLERKSEVYPKTTEELLSAVKEWDDYYGGKLDYYVDFSSSWGLNNIKRERSKAKTRKTKQWVETKGYYVLKGDVGYFVRNLKYGYKYAYTSTGAKKFIDEKSANKFHKSMKNRDLFNIVMEEKLYPVPVQV